jgi:hypothetical protein
MIPSVSTQRYVVLFYLMLGYAVLFAILINVVLFLCIYLLYMLI